MRYNPSMNLHHSAFIRLSLVIVLASVVLAMLPTALLAHDADLDVSPPGQTTTFIFIYQAARSLDIKSQRSPLTLTLALRTKLHPTLVKQLLTASNDQLPVHHQVARSAEFESARYYVSSRPQRAPRGAW